MKLYALPENTLNQVLGYLAAKPFAEVNTLIASIQKAQLVVDGDGKAIEIPDEASVTPVFTESKEQEATA